MSLYSQHGGIIGNKSIGPMPHYYFPTKRKLAPDLTSLQGVVGPAVQPGWKNVARMRVGDYNVGGFKGADKPLFGGRKPAFVQPRHKEASYFERMRFDGGAVFSDWGRSVPMAPVMRTVVNDQVARQYNGGCSSCK